MAPRSYWKGHLKLSLVSCPIQVFPAISDRARIRFHQINSKTGNRIKYCKVDAVTGQPVSDEHIVMGYEVDKGRYVEVTEAELQAVAAGATHTIDIDEFVPRNEIDQLYWNIPYYIAPDGQVGRQAMKKENMVALGNVVFTTREHVMVLQPRGKGMPGVTLRYAYEIRQESDYFGDIPDEKIPSDMLDFAVDIVKSKAAHFRPNQLEDHYEKTLKELIQKKRRGERIEKTERPWAEVINLLDALRRSAAGEHGGTRSRAATRARPGPARRSGAAARRES